MTFGFSRTALLLIAIELTSKCFGQSSKIGSSRKFPQIYGAGLEWPPYSPDLAPNDFFLWAYLKDRAYKDDPRNLTELAKKVDDVMSTVTPKMCHSAIRSFEGKLRKVAIAEGNFSNTYPTEIL